MFVYFVIYFVLFSSVPRIICSLQISLYCLLVLVSVSRKALFRCLMILGCPFKRVCIENSMCSNGLGTGFILRWSQAFSWSISRGFFLLSRTVEFLVFFQRSGMVTYACLPTFWKQGRKRMRASWFPSLSVSSTSSPCAAPLPHVWFSHLALLY